MVVTTIDQVILDEKVCIYQNESRSYSQLIISFLGSDYQQFL